MDLKETALERYREGYSCAQSVFSALATKWDIEPGVALRIAAGFGGGFARTGGTCGCVSGGVMAIGLAQRGISPEENRAQKDHTCELARRFMSAFEQSNGSLLCRDLLGCNIGTPEGLAEARQKGLFQSRCAKLIQDAVELVGNTLVG